MRERVTQLEVRCAAVADGRGARVSFRPRRRAGFIAAGALLGRPFPSCPVADAHAPPAPASRALQVELRDAQRRNAELEDDAKKVPGLGDSFSCERPPSPLVS
jgi:hypothetical protein